MASRTSSSKHARSGGLRWFAQTLLSAFAVNAGQRTRSRESRMLKITSTVLTQEQTALRLDGRVAGQWVALLRESAESALAKGLKLTLDLQNISYIDCEGIVLLTSLITRGVDPINAPLFVIEQIKKCKDGE